MGGNGDSCNTPKPIRTFWVNNHMTNSPKQVTQTTRELRICIKYEKNRPNHAKRRKKTYYQASLVWLPVVVRIVWQ